MGMLVQQKGKSVTESAYKMCTLVAIAIYKGMDCAPLLTILRI